jgi:hypothetical protein
MSGDRLFDSPAPMPGQLGLEREAPEAAEAWKVEHAPITVEISPGFVVEFAGPACAERAGYPQGNRGRS